MNDNEIIIISCYCFGCGANGNAKDFLNRFDELK
jgi:DNA primase